MGIDFLSSEMQPFFGAAALLAALIALEIIALLFGGSLLGLGSEADVDIDVDLDLDADLDVDLPAGVELDLDGPVAGDEMDVAQTAGGMSGIWVWLGLGQIPVIMWFGALLAGFSGAGVLIQYGAQAVLGAPLAPLWASLLALPLAVLFAREVGSLIARFMPKSESSAVSIRRLGSRPGVITQGTAREGSPAEARVRDVHGNLHYIRVVPAAGGTNIPQGTHVIILRDRDGTFRAYPTE
ncbi:hypothetical protein FHS89_000817 [Rubricella aquisinus]|uniref:DUF1449 family protein n=1 Tax=Rubricella aquisinus TaxID=2028108 RepID=A0A840WJV5_9RHOB|nr:OB-fold-containig protein [Rubricella aquisinus]MBB5514811.1 hypothetical protein [Rubricella aquisinus]